LPPFEGARVAGSGPCRLSLEADQLRPVASEGDGLEAELDQRAFLKGFRSVELKELLQVVGALAQPRPQGGPFETAVQTSTEATQMFGHGNKAFGRGTGFATGLLLGLIDIQAASHKEMVDLLGLTFRTIFWNSEAILPEPPEESSERAIHG